MSYDAADKLNIQAMPIPTEQRLDVFVCLGVSRDAMSRWLTQAGTTTFHEVECSFNLPDWGKDLAQVCGMALFVVGADGRLDALTSAQLQPFYDRAGAEANVFQWQEIERNFVRRDVHWFNERKTA